MRDHPLVLAKSHQLALGYDDAEAIVRGSRDPASKAAVAEIDAARAAERERVKGLNADMTKRLGLTAGQARALVAALTADPALETWLLRRVYLTRADGRAPDDDSHPTNE